MPFELDILEMSRGLAAHATVRQGLIAENIANADTPGYRAVDLADFADVFENSDFDIKSTRAGHLAGADATNWSMELQAGQGDEKPNGNNVSIESQMIKSLELRQSHDLALGVYRKSLDILRLALGRGR